MKKKLILFRIYQKKHIVVRRESRMSQLDQIIGANVRLYRRANRLTLEELAARIHKSKATLGKYEQGTIAMDVNTLGRLPGPFSWSRGS